MTLPRIAVVVALLALIGVGLWLVLEPESGTAVPPDPVSAFPGPDARAASPGTQISLRGLPAHRLGEIEVKGSESGNHEGELRGHSDGQGASFVPAEPFEPGEEVTVRSDLTVRGTRNGDFRFDVAVPAANAPKPVVEPPREGGSVQNLVTREDMKPPAVTVTTSRGAAPGYVFIAPKRGEGQDGLMMLDKRGKIVWWRAMEREGKQAVDFRVQRYGGRPVLTWWEGGTNIGTGFGEGVILDQNYREVLRVPAANGYQADLHEFMLTPRGTAYLIIYSFVEADLSEVDGPKEGSVLDSVVQEIDLRTGLVLFEWHSLDHIGLAESAWPLPSGEQKGAPYDYVHLNSVGLDTDGNLLMSGRHSWTIYKVDSGTGEVIWRLGGKKSDFKPGPGAKFAFQHDARRRRSDGALTLFDNAAGPPETREASRFLALKLDEDAGTAEVVDQFEHPTRVISDSQGNSQSMPNGHTFVGWGSQPLFTEHDENGRVVLSGKISEGNDNYRAYRGRWTGTPNTEPAVVASEIDGRPVLTASWNGATEVARWQLLTGDDPEELRAAGSTRKRGFETRLPVRERARWLAARALDASGAVLATSEPVEAP